MIPRRPHAANGVSVVRQDAFTLVTLLVFVAVLNVMVAVALPLWTQQIQREKEEELIFRGLQYAEAIRVFQQRAGRYPVRLEELLEIQPRSIRQLWKDPMTESGEWDLIVAQTAGQARGRNLTPQAQAEQRPRRRRGRRQPETVTIGPISGVRSKSTEKAIKVWMGGDTHNAWVFTAEVLPIAPSAPGERIPSLNSRWVGRPFPQGVEAMDGTGIEDGFEDEKGEQEEERNRRRRRRPSRSSDGA